MNHQSPPPRAHNFMRWGSDGFLKIYGIFLKFGAYCADFITHSNSNRKYSLCSLALYLPLITQCSKNSLNMNRVVYLLIKTYRSISMIDIHRVTCETHKFCCISSIILTFAHVTSSKHSLSVSTPRQAARKEYMILHSVFVLGSINISRALEHFADNWASQNNKNSIWIIIDISDLTHHILLRCKRIYKIFRPKCNNVSICLMPREKVRNLINILKYLYYLFI